jgi:hypothetical protein
VNSLIRYTLWIFILLLGNKSQAQAPVNDNCENALEIVIPDAGFAFDTISAPRVNVHKATRQQGEHCAEELEENGNCVKTIWYKFYLPTTRNVGIKLTQQDSAIPQIFSGFNIYRIHGCNYTISDFADQLTPLNKFGISGNACLGQGWYMVQVGCKQKAKGEIWLELEISKPSAEKYDNIDGLYDFTRQFNGYAQKQFDINCASVDRIEATQLKDSMYSKSIWAKFRVEPNSEESALGITSNGLIKYRIFYDNIHPDSINSKRPFQYMAGSGTILSELCPGYNTGRTYYLQVVFSRELGYLNIGFESHILDADPWNTPNTNEEMDVVKNTYQNSRSHVFNCFSVLASHACKNAIPTTFIKTHI